MAQEVPISGGPTTAKIRNVLFVPTALTLSFLFYFAFIFAAIGFDSPALAVGALVSIAAGLVYFTAWWYLVNREMADLGRMRGSSDLGEQPWLSAVAIFPGSLIVVPGIWTTVTTYQRAKRAQQLVGVAPHNQANPWIYGISWVVLPIVTYGYLQNELNKVWRIDSGQVAPAGAATPAPHVPPSPSSGPPA